MGGWGRADAGILAISDSWEIYRRSSRSFETGDGKLAGGPYGAAASVGSEGILHCGGVRVLSGNLKSSAGCNLLQPSGSVLVLAEVLAEVLAGIRWPSASVAGPRWPRSS